VNRRKRGPKPRVDAAAKIAVLAALRGGGRLEDNRRLLQRRKLRHVRFTEARRKVFLAHFCWSCDAVAAAAQAGVCERTVYEHRRKDPVFARLFLEALEQGYIRLEVESVRQRLAAQERLREAIESSDPVPLAGEIGAEFERVMKLLARWDRRDGRIGPRERSPGSERVATFEEAIVALDKALVAFGVRRGIIPPGEGGEDGEGDEGDEGDEGETPEDQS
jgi:hypothetical protein